MIEVESAFPVRLVEAGFQDGKGLTRWLDNDGIAHEVACKNVHHLDRLSKILFPERKSITGNVQFDPHVLSVVSQTLHYSLELLLDEGVSVVALFTTVKSGDRVFVEIYPLGTEIQISPKKEFNGQINEMFSLKDDGVRVFQDSVGEIGLVTYEN